MNDDFHRLSDQELAQLIGKEHMTPKIREMVRKAKNDQGLNLLLDEAARDYWGRQLQKCEVLPDAVVSELLAYPLHASSRNVVGEAAMSNKIDSARIAHVLSCLSTEEWSYRQVFARKLVNAFVSRGCSAVYSDGIRGEDEGIIDKLLETKSTWALLEVLPRLDSQALESLMSRMSTTRELTRQDRHVVREQIRKEKRRRI